MDEANNEAENGLFKGALIWTDGDILTEIEANNRANGLSKEANEATERRRR